MATVVVVESTGPPPPCGALYGSVLASPLAAPPTGGGFTRDSVVVSVSALVLLVAIGAVFLSRRLRKRPVHGGERVAPAGQRIVPVRRTRNRLGAAVAPVLQRRLRPLPECRTVSEDQALSLAPLLSVVFVVLAAAWVAVAVRSAFTRGVAKA